MLEEHFRKVHGPDVEDRHSDHHHPRDVADALHHLPVVELFGSRELPHERLPRIVFVGEQASSEEQPDGCHGELVEPQTHHDDGEDGEPHHHQHWLEEVEQSRDHGTSLLV